MSEIILQTKLNKPPLRPYLVPRPQLIHKLNAGLDGNLTILSAPAGFGKTTLVVNWLAQVERPFTWLSLDEDDNDLHTFFSYLNAALRSLAGIGNALSGLLQAAPSAPGKAYISALINDVTTVTQPFILILDDYHLIEKLEIHQAVAFWLDHMPVQMYLVITSRVDPMLPLPRLRARGQMVELRTDDLRFADTETAVFLQQTMGLDLDPKLVAPLSERIEGWVAGLQMAALSLQQFQTDAQIKQFVSEFTASHRYIFDYLTDEVLQQRPPETQDFLLQTSILERFNASLCTAVTGQNNSQEILQTLDNANLFLFPLDEHRNWYRYHHLFADLLRKRLQTQQPTLLPELCRRASNWYAQRDEIETAVHYAVTGKDKAEAARLLDTVAFEYIRRSETTKLLRLAEAIPDEVQNLFPQLCLAQGWAYLFAGKLDVASSYVNRAELGLMTPDGLTEAFPEPFAQASIATVRAYIATRQNEFAQAIHHSEAALALLNTLPEAMANPQRGSILVNLGQTQTALEEAEKAEASYRQSIIYNKANGRIFAVMAAYSNLMVLQQRRGQLLAAKAAGQQSVAWLESYRQDANQLFPAEGEVRRQLVAIFYEQNQLEEAQRQLDIAIELYRYIGPVSYLDCLHYLFLLTLARGDVETAVTIQQQAEPLINEMVTPHLKPFYAAKRGDRLRRLSLAQPTELRWLEELQQWLSTLKPEPTKTINYYHETISLVQAQVLTLLDQLETAVSILNQLADTAESAKRWGDLLCYRVQQALVLARMGQRKTAVSHLEEAVTLAEAEGYVRTFLDEAAGLLPLMVQARTSAYRNQLLAQLRAETEAKERSTKEKSVVPDTPLDPLSEREAEVLAMLATHLSGPEIAEQLHISTNTLKTHTKNIYSKLGVNGRNEAVVKAQTTGLI